MDGRRLIGGACLALLVASGIAGFAGCSLGSPASPSLGPSSSEAGVSPSTLPPSTNAIRLTHPQWENTTQALLKLAAPSGLSASFYPDPGVAKDQFGIDVSQLGVSTELWHDYQGAAEALATLVTDPTKPALLQAILPAAAQAAGDPDARLNAFLTDFLPRAYRRPVTPAEIAAVVKIADDAATGDISQTPSDDPFIVRMKWAISAILQAPNFLYRIEGGSDTQLPNGRYALTSYERAEKLAYALWNTMPDDSLTALAAADKLTDPADVAAQAKVMLADPRANNRLADFHDLLFNVTSYGGVQKSAKLFPLFYPGVGGDATTDVRSTVKDLVIDHPGGVKALYTSDEVYVNYALAKLYGIDPLTVPGLNDDPNNFHKGNFTADSKRVGILTHIGWLAYYSHTQDPASILRGVWAARHLLCITLGSPPAAAAGKDPETHPQPTNRGRIIDTTSPCGDACHKATINPLGFSFEEFDALGVFRTSETNGGTDYPIDSTGAIPLLGSFVDAPSMLAAAVAKIDTHACYAAHWNAYLNGTPAVADPPAYLAPIAAKSMAGASTRDIIVELVQTDAFLTVSRQ